MTLVVRAVPYGPPAARQLRAEIDGAQRGDPLAPVTVVVPRGAVGLSLRRLLSSGRVAPGPGGHPGLGNVRFLTPAALAAALDDGALGRAGRRPLTGAVLAAAVRGALSGAPAPFDAVAQHPATVRAVGAAFRDLRGVPDEGLAAVAAAGPRPAALVAVVRTVRAALEGWYDEAALARSAAERLAAGAAPVGELGHLVWFLPGDLGWWGEALLQSLAAAVEVTVLVGRTGEAEADGPARDLCARVGAPLSPPLRTTAPVPPGRVSVVNAPTADVEVLEALRGVLGHLERGVPLERIAVVDGGTGPYRRLVREQLALAGVPFHGPAVRMLSATVAARTLLGLFELAEGGWRREDVMAWVSGAPVRHGGRPVPATAWDVLSADAGVVAGVEQWRQRLAAHRDGLVRRAADLSPDEPEWRRERLASDARRSGDLLDFFDGLVARLAEPPHRWAGWAEWSERVLADYLGGPAARAGWPAAEELALTEVRDVLASLRALDDLGHAAAPDASAFRTALSGDLDQPAPETARAGRGVLVGGMADLVGMDVEVAYVLGMVDGAFPAAGREDPLLPDRERALAGPRVPLRLGRRAEARRDYLAALAGPATVVLSFSRGDQRQGRALRPSRWILDAVGAVAAGGRHLYARDLEYVAPCEGYRVVASYTEAVAAPGAALSASDVARRTLVRWREGHRHLAGHGLASSEAALARGLEVRAARSGPAFTRFDGLVTGLGVHLADAPQSPTGVESYGTCPRRYLFERVLSVRGREKPEEVVRISPRDRGTLVHRILERFVAARLAVPPGEARRAPWSPDERRYLEDLWEEECGHAEQQGLTGWPLLWGMDRLAILQDLRRFVDEDDRLRARTGAGPEAVEEAFGLPAVAGSGPLLEVTLPDGRRVAFRGRIDRVDVTADGEVVVTDYKTGSDYGSATVLDEVGHGRKLQLPVYALAAAARRPGAPVRSRYWYVSGRGGFSQVEYRLDPPARAQFETVLGAIADGVSAGLFPARSGPRGSLGFENCTFCDFDGLCPQDRDRGWHRKRQDPALGAYVALAEQGVPR